MDKEKHAHSLSHFANKVWITVGITTFAVIIVFIIFRTFNAFLLVLAASLIALFFSAVSGRIKMWTGLKNGVSLALTIALMVVVVGLFFWLVGAEAQNQYKEMQEAVPVIIDNAQSYLNKSDVGQKVSQYISDIENQKKVLPFLQNFFKSSFGVFGDLYIVIFLALFISISPFDYINGAVNLVPRRGKVKAKHLFTEIGFNLKKWIKGAIISGLSVFIMSAVGLLILGVDMWLILAISAGLLNVIPNFGPIIAMIPAVLVALLTSPTQALMVAGLYLTVQIIESNLITPNVQKKLLNTPPALLILFQVLMGTLTGGWGIVLAVPMLVIVITMVKYLYLDDNMGVETEKSV
ncbi:MAG TPA: AI-2E family transporter [Bacteroidales bacterium]|nr:AI-2E family transporter [Bacteroidales bacterium]